jgi:predicted nucleotidyltransferase
MNRLTPYIKEIERLCNIYKVKNLYAFGSILNKHYNSESDIDLLVNFAEINLEDYADNYFDFKFSLEGILKKPVDLLEEKAVKNPYLRESIDHDRQLLYGS